MTYNSASERGIDVLDGDADSCCCNRKWCWWSPESATIISAYCYDPWFEIYGTAKTTFNGKVSSKMDNFNKP